MTIISRIAWRNLNRHRGKSLVIGCILFTGTLIMTVGNAVISGLDNGLAANFRERLTGDIVIVSKNQLKDNVFFTPFAEPIESINKLDTVLAYLSKQTPISMTLPIAKGMVTVLNDDAEPFFQLLIGVDFNRYQAVFPNGIQILSGAIPSTDHSGVIITTKSQEELFNFSNVWAYPINSKIDPSSLPDGISIDSVTPKNQMIYMGFSDRNTSLDIIVPVAGIGKYAAFNGMWGYFSLIDIQSYNQCMGYFENASTIEITPENKALLNHNTDDLDQILFSDTPQENRLPTSSPTTVTVPPIDSETSGYNLILVRLKKNQSIPQTLTSLNAGFAKNNLPVRAISWKSSIGQVGQIAMLMRAVLFGFVMVVFIVAIIVITNTLSLAAMERITEIGMMRAIGTRKWIISKIVVMETFILSSIFGGAGIFVGILCIFVLNLIHLPAPNDFVELLFGGPIFQPTLSADGLILLFIQLWCVTILSMIYPMMLVRRISPMDAISRE